MIVLSTSCAVTSTIHYSPLPLTPTPPHPLFSLSLSLLHFLFLIYSQCHPDLHVPTAVTISSLQDTETPLVTALFYISYIFIVLEFACNLFADRRALAHGQYGDHHYRDTETQPLLGGQEKAEPKGRVSKLIYLCMLNEWAIMSLLNLFVLGMVLYLAYPHTEAEAISTLLFNIPPLKVMFCNP